MPERQFRRLLLGAAAALTLLAALPARAFSTLAGWRIAADGVVELRTADYTNVTASYEAGSGGRGPRVWFDLPGSPSRPRGVAGGGPVRAVRIGQPQPGLTRLVIEFEPWVEIDPARLKLEAVDRDTWRLQLPLYPGRAYVLLGEGSLETPAAAPVLRPRTLDPSALPAGPASPRAPLRTLTPADLPQLNRGRFRIVIDPGHGGPDPGAVGIGGTQEKDVVLEVSRQIRDLLQSRGVEVLMTRDGDIDVDLPPRAQLANASGAHAFVSVHANALNMSRPDVNGLETFYFQSVQGKNLASAIHNSIMGTVRREDRGVREGRFYVIRATRVPATLVELGFLTGADDAADLADPAHRRQLALAVTAGILEYLNQN